MLEIGVKEQALVDLPLEAPSLIIIQYIASRQIIIVGLKGSFVDDLPEGNGYGISFGPDRPV